MAPPVEISIPSTSLSPAENGSKPFTLYNITLRLPLRSFIVQKRYSEFAKLNDALLSLVGDAPPSPLPAKSWLRSTVASAVLTRQRQLGLEAYLRAIAESPDRRWRDTSAWRTFLNLPPPSAASSVASAPVMGVRRQKTGGPTDPVVWLDQHREAKACLHEARLCLARRDAAAESDSSASAVAEAGAAAKKALVKSGTLMVGLAEGLRAIEQAAGRAMGEGELRRRRDLLAAAQVERDGLERLSQSIAAAEYSIPPSSFASTSAPSSPWAGRRAGGGERAALRMGSRVIGGPAAETHRTRELDNNGVLLLQKQEVESQDAQLELLAQAIGRQKQLGMEMHQEFLIQNEMLDVVDRHVDRVGGKVKVASNRIKKMS